MKILQTQILKNIVSTAGFLLLLYSANAQSHVQHLKKADSLFQAKQYTQSFEIYSALLKEKQYSPAMLLKMAFIQEGLGHVSQSLYYLDLYYLISHDEQALGKMEEIAVKNRLEGYQPTDVGSLLARLQRYSFQMMAGLLATVIFFFALTLYQKVRQHKRPIAPAFLLLFFSALLFFQAHLGDYTKMGIVSQSSTYLMSGPSAGSSVVGIIGEGHQLKILGQTDVWVKVNWKDQEVFIKENFLQSVTL